MNILIATGIYPPDIGGPATYTKLMGEELVKRGHGVTVVSYYHQKTLATSFRFVGISRKFPKGVRHVLYFFALLKHGRRADCIYAQDPVSVGVPAFFASRVLRKPLIVKVVGDYAWEQGMQRFGVTDLLDDFSKNRYGFFVEMLRRAESYVARSAARVIVPSEYLRGIVRLWGVEDSKIAVIANSFSLPPLLKKEEAKRDLNISKALLLSIGRLVPWKGFEVLIDIMQDTDAILVIVGDGPLRERLERQVARIGVQNRVMFTGALSKERLAVYLAAADIFCLNTAYEGMSHQVLEAMAAGLPVITTLAGGNKEIVDDGENAVVVGFNNKNEWREKLRILLGSAPLRERLGACALEIRPRYTADRMVEQTIHIFENVCTS